MRVTDRIVRTPQRVDLHIHSAASTKTRDKGKERLERCTAESVSLLAHRLSKEKVTICAITDHDIFDYGVYTALKAYEGKDGISCVLPGVEFTVCFIDNDLVNSGKPDSTIIHVVAIFDDGDDSKLRELNSKIVNNDGHPAYDCEDGNGSFTSDKFTKIIREIGLDSILIGHEKSAGQEGDHDVSSLGVEKANEAILTEFVDAVELHNRHKELNIKRLIEVYPRSDVPFVFGTDCHDWEAYPLIDSSYADRKDEIAFSSVKCLPSFRGLVMAMTDSSRIKSGNCSFFNAASAKLDAINLSIAGKSIEIPLSPGINAIIGDNSIGKSLLMHKITSNREITGRANKSLRDGYDSYCEHERIEVSTQLSKSKTFRFDDQRKVRKLLEELHGGESADSYFNQYFEHRVPVDFYRNFLKNHFRRCFAAFEEKVRYNDYLESLSEVEVVVEDTPRSTALSINLTIENEDIVEVEKVIADVKTEIDNLNQIAEEHATVITMMDSNARVALSNAMNELRIFLRYANALKRERELSNMKINAIRNSAKIVKSSLDKTKSDEQKHADARQNELTGISHSLAQAVLMKARRCDKSFDPGIGTIANGISQMGTFVFVSTLNEGRLDSEFCKGVLSKVFNTGVVEDIIGGIEHETSMTSSQFVAGFSNDKPSREVCFATALSKINSVIDSSLGESRRITNKAIGIDRAPSAGLYSQIYFDLISDAEESGVYIIDQPEDQISQKSIKEDVLSAFKRMAEHRQVLLITHNPQFVVNLDVDNVIAMLRGENGEIVIQSGALEYVCPEYNMLDVVAETVEGGADVVRKRLKRYGSDENLTY